MGRIGPNTLLLKPTLTGRPGYAATCLRRRVGVSRLGCRACPSSFRARRRSTPLVVMLGLRVRLTLGAAGTVSTSARPTEYLGTRGVTSCGRCPALAGTSFSSAAFRRSLRLRSSWTVGRVGVGIALRSEIRTGWTGSSIASEDQGDSCPMTRPRVLLRTNVCVASPPSRRRRFAACVCSARTSRDTRRRRFGRMPAARDAIRGHYR
jgi:hypothetical protein